MKIKVQDGDIITVTAPYALTSGQGALVGALFGIATSAAALSAEVEIATEGVFDITALNTDTGTVGTKVYWDNGNRRCTVTVGSNILIGCLTAAKANGETTMRVRLNATVV